MRPIHAIATEIKTLCQKPYFGAVPYLEAMFDLVNTDDSYLLDSGRSIILYFLSNASAWRGPDAKRIKAELKQMLKDGPKTGVSQ